ncbi:nucleoside monophosphate kinase [Candidatus Curtissbacteria bacterium]|nr:nucleoside monophosphate kinase [Candidatus Curtissbacteria bacterium]
MKYIFLGPQGSGKSTQAKLLAEKLGLPYIEMSKLLREKLNDEDEDAYVIKKAFASGDLVPPKIVVHTLNQKLQEIKNGYVLDGFPRNLTQFQGFKDKVDKIFYVAVSDEEAIKRLMLRKREDDSPQVIARRLELYHKETEPLLEDLKKENLLSEINGEQSIAQIANEIEKVLDESKKIN